MSITYNITTNFASKDALPDNDPGKVIRGSDFSAEFTAIQTAFLTAAPTLNPTFTGTSTFSSVDINGGSVDGTVIGASSKAAGSFTTLTATGLSVLPSVNIDGGAIDGTTIGASVPSTGAFTTLSASGISGPLAGNVTGNLTGNVTGDVVGNVIGNISAVTGTSSFNNVTINGSLDMVAGTSATITNLSTPVNDSDAATKAYVDTGIANLIDSAPGALDTLNELAAALGDDANFATTTANSLATKLPLSGGTMTGDITLSYGKVTGLALPSSGSDAVPKGYVDAIFLSKFGGTLLGAIEMGSNKITSSYVPVDDYDLTNKLYVEGIAGSAAAAAQSAADALQSENNAATSETNALNSASAALASENAAATLYDSFDDRYLGAKGSDPALDNDGDALITGALYFNTTSSDMKVYNGSAWVDAYTSIAGQTLDEVTATGNTTTNSITVGNLTSTGIDDNAASTAITITGTGRVGIDNTNPALFPSDQQHLVIGDGSASVGATIYSSAAGIGNLRFADGTNLSAAIAGGIQYDHNIDVLSIETGGIAAINVDSSRNVGIGTSSPSAVGLATTLHVNDDTNGGAVRIGDATTNMFIDCTTANGTRVRANTGEMLVGTNAANPLNFITSATERMRIDASGNVGIGTASPSEKLNVSGNILATGNVTAYSDERLKSDIETLDGSKVYEMRGVSYVKDGEASSGVIAQELQKVAPELVNESGEYLSVAYGNLVGYLIEAVKELKAEIDELKGVK